MRDDDMFWDGARRGQLLVQACGDCGLVRHPPVPMCARCHSVAVDIRECSGHAKVLGWVNSKHPTRRDDQDERIVVRLALDEGVYMVGNLQGIALGDIREGMAVEVFFQDYDGVTLPQFRPAAEASA